jgi:PEP-CTERM motif
MRPALRKGLRIFSVGAFVALMVGVAQAMPFHYSESADGDLAGLPSTAFSFGIGNNTISGSTHFAVNIAGPGPHYDTDFDSFALDLPAGSRLVNISLAFTTASSNTVSADAELRLCLGVSNCLSDVLGYRTVSFFDAPPLQVDFGSALPLSAGTYTLLTHGLGIGPAVDLSLSESWSVDYTWTLRVIPVPEPSDLLLLGLGLAGLAFTRRYKH